MPVIRLEGPLDPRVAVYRDVPEPELVRARGLFVAEGRLVVGRLIQDRRYRVQSLLLNDAALEALAPELAALDSTVPVYVGDRSLFLAVTGFNLHRGCLALVQRPEPRQPADLLRHARLVVALEGVTNADNVGGVFRNAAAFGADAVLLSPTCCDPLYRKALRTSMGAVLRVPFARVSDWPGGLHALARHRFEVVALTPAADALALEGLVSARPARAVLLVGTEGHGLTDAAVAVADRCVRIPIRPEVDSLNLAVATGIALFHLAGPSVTG
jgi:tRNA G18 (ribose-2'-O)-methylase SpoU